MPLYMMHIHGDSLFKGAKNEYSKYKGAQNIVLRALGHIIPVR